METRHRQIVDKFQIANRGTVVVLEGKDDWPPGISLEASVLRPDGAQFTAVIAGRERRPPEGQEGYLISVQKSEIPEGSLFLGRGQQNARRVRAIEDDDVALRRDGMVDEGDPITVG